MESGGRKLGLWECALNGLLGPCTLSPSSSPSPQFQVSCFALPCITTVCFIQGHRSGSSDMDYRHKPTQPCPSCKLMHRGCLCGDRGACVQYGFSSLLSFQGVQNSHSQSLRSQYSLQDLLLEWSPEPLTRHTEVNR